ncbi:MAG: beta-lactamase family protein [Clostridiales bacterium]|nr:beta-lactamase family protein [Clostridiales bacterium]
MRKFLKDFAAFMENQPFRIIRLSEVQGDGEIETWEMQEANPCQDTYSVSKTFVMTGIGLLWDRGLIALDEKLTDILDPALSPETKAKMDPRWHLATVEMALTHRLGLPGGFLDIDCCNVADFGEDYLAYTMTYPLAYTPGTDEKYSDGAFYLLTRAAAVRTGVALDRYLWPNLFYPLGYREMAWSSCPHGHPVGGSGLYIGSEDMVKLGMIYRDGGLYRGRRILSEAWTKLAVERGFALDWDDEHRVYFKGGMFGQKLIVAPEADRVVALQAYGANSDTVMKFVRDYRD